MKPELLISLKGYKKKYLFSDLTAGLLVAIIALPLSVAMGIQSGVSAQSGLISAIVGGFFIALLSGSRFSIGGPSATFITLTITYLAAYGMIGMQLITIMAGVILIVSGFLKVGKILRFVPFPIVIGFTAGIGVILLVGQAKDFLGLTPSEPLSPDFFLKIGGIFKSLNTFNGASFLIGAATLALIYLLPKAHKKIPSVFVALVIGTLISVILKGLFKTDTTIQNIKTLGDLSVSFNFIDFSSIGTLKIWELIFPAFIIAVLSALEGLLSATVAEGMTSYIHDPNMELIGHGAGNIGSALLGGIPVTGAIARTSANIGAGARSPLAGIFHALILLIIYVALMPIMKFVPYSVLAAVLIKVAITMSKFKQFIKFTVFGIRDSLILLTSFLCTVFFGVQYGLLAGLIMAFVSNAKSYKYRLKIEPAELESIKNYKKFREIDRKIYALSGALYFINIVKLNDFIKKEIETTSEIILDMDNLLSIDATCVEKLAKLAKTLAKNGKRLYLHSLKPKAYQRYKKAFSDIIRVW